LAPTFNDAGAAGGLADDLVFGESDAEDCVAKWGDVDEQEICLPLKVESIGHGRCGHSEGVRNYSVELRIDYK
jgi:hypothetical protein